MIKEEILFPCSAVQLDKIKAYFTQLEFSSSIPGLYWLPVPEEMLTNVQTEHLISCGPYALALEITKEGLILETLVRAQNQLHCGCISFATEQLAQHMLNYLNLILLQKAEVTL